VSHHSISIDVSSDLTPTGSKDSVGVNDFRVLGPANKTHLLAALVANPWKTSDDTTNGKVETGQRTKKLAD
jgi:hypothetical protein